MANRLRALTLGESINPVVNGILEFSQGGFGDTSMFGLLASWHEVLKRMYPLKAGHPYATMVSGSSSRCR